MENKLRAMFDFQRFENDPRLGSLIEDSLSRCARELSDDELDLVAAAGDPYPDSDASQDEKNG